MRIFVSIALTLMATVLPLVTGLAEVEPAVDTAVSVRTTSLHNDPDRIDRLAYEYFVLGLLAEGFGEYSSAVSNFEKAWGIEPDLREFGVSYARALFNLRNYDGALKATERLIPFDVGVLELRADCYRGLRDAAMAADAYLGIVALDSSHSTAYMFLTDYYRRNRNFDSTVWSLQNLARVMPTRYEIANDLAGMYLARGKLDEAKDEFRRSLQLMPASANSQAFARLVGIFEDSNQPDSIPQLFKDALARTPGDPALHHDYAYFLLGLDSVSQAMPHLQLAVEAMPEDYDARRRLALSYFSLDSLTIADSIFEALIADGDDVPLNQFYLGRIAIVRKDYPRARGKLTMVTDEAAGFVDAWMALGFVFSQTGEIDKELDTYREGILHMREEADAVKLFYALGATFEKIGEVDSAIVTFEEILDHDPDHAQTLNYLGYTLADRGLRLEYARDLLEKAIQMQPRNPAFLDSYGWVYYRLGQFDRAVEYLSVAAALDSDPVIYDHLGDAYFANGERDKAREWWTKALQMLPDDENIAEKLSR